MSDSEFESRIRRERGKAALRTIHAAALEDAGRERAAALKRADEQLDRIARLLPDALEAGLGMTEIARSTGVSRPTLYELRGRYSGESRDLRLAVMQALMSQATSSPDALAKHLGRSEQQIAEILNDFLEREWIDWDDHRFQRIVAWEPGQGLVLGEDEEEALVVVTLKGVEALERWKFEDDAEVDRREGSDAV